MNITSKWILGTVISFIFCTGALAQNANVNTGILQIEIYTSQLTGDCNLYGVDTVYMHSGLGWTNSDSVWESIVGHWGYDDGVGEMTGLGGDTFSICFNVKEYYSQLADPDSTQPGGVGFGPMNVDSTPYNIGVVFRQPTCPLNSLGQPIACSDPQTGKDESCNNIYIYGLNMPNADSTITVYDNDGDPFTAVFARYIQTCAGYSAGIPEVGNLTSINVYPVPFETELRIEFKLISQSKATVQIFDVLGREVIDLSSHVIPGLNSISWNGRDASGRQVAAGTYFLHIANGTQTFNGKIIKQ